MKKSDKIFTTVGMIVAFVFVVGMTFGMVSGCCTPEKPVATAYPFTSGELHIKGFDIDCDGKIDYWQHYNSFGNEVGSKIWVKRK